MIIPPGSCISDIFKGVLIPDMRFQPSLKLSVSSLIDMPEILILPASQNLNQYPSPCIKLVSRLYPSSKEYKVPSIDSGNK